MHFISNALVFALAALPFVTPTPVPRYIARHRSRSAKLSALNLVDGDVKQNSYIVSLSPFSRVSLTNITLHHQIKMKPCNVARGEVDARAIEVELTCNKQVGLRPLPFAAIFDDHRPP